MSVMTECKPYVDNIMDDVSTILTENKVEFSVNGKNTEIIAPDISADKVETILGKLNIPKMVLFCLLDIVESKNKVYVRQRVG